jgi:SpoVK/Ycf46/Vps4 family AAA+-type ATPase
VTMVAADTARLQAISGGAGSPARADAVDTGNYLDSLDHLLDELQVVHWMVTAEVRRVRAQHKADGHFQGCVISEEDVDALLASSPGGPQHGRVPKAMELDLRTAIEGIREDIAVRKSTSIRQGATLRLADFECCFGLTRFETDVLLICLASELDSSYQRLYAYLQDDATRKGPNVDLVLKLLCSSFQDRVVQRHYFLPGSTLVDNRILAVSDDPHEPATLLNRAINVDQRIVNHLTGSDAPDSRISRYLRRSESKVRVKDLILPVDTKDHLSVLAQGGPAGEAMLYFHGPYGSGRKTAAAAICRERGLGLLVADIEALANDRGLSFETSVRLASREALLQSCALYWDGIDFLLQDDKKFQRRLFLAELAPRPKMTFVGGTAVWEPGEELRELALLRVEFPRPGHEDRMQIWKAALPGDAGVEVDLSAVAGRFRLTPGQIGDAARSALNAARWRNAETTHLTTADLYEACRLHSSRKLSSLGSKITPHHTWPDIVLPEDRLQQLREICNSMKYRSLVFDQWGFDRKLSSGKGLNVLFAGPSGTGKTMAAEIMAGELGLDLYKIDLSTVVSKYIGETEKNLARIFAEAETSNAILFFDEADALFGKRSEVRDSHDRYANIEINYLLQKMEEHEGVVILATNFRKNMDDAFVRRMQFTVEFAFPGENDRRRIWEQIWPNETPKGTDLDLDFMARRFELPGGNIRNIAMAAAFLAASDGGTVKMTHLLHGTRREYQKMGKVVTHSEFQ